MRLWEYDDEGEPWLENSAPLVIVNGKRKVHKKGKKKTMRRRKRRVTRRRRTTRVHHRGVRRTTRRRRRRSNPWPMAGSVVGINGRRRRRRGRKNASRRRHHRRGRRNPALMGLSVPPLKLVAYGAAGFVGTPLVEGFLAGFLPTTITGTTIGKWATRIASALGLMWVSKMALGKAASMSIGIGAGIYVATSAVREFMPTLLPAGTLSAYVSPSRNYSRGGLNAYARPTSRPFNALGAANYGAFNTTNAAPFGGMNLVSQRFRRFN